MAADLFKSTIPVKSIDAKHADWTAKFPFFERLRKLYEGEPTLRAFASEFLHKHAMEMPDVYNDRVERFAYINHLKTILNWYTSALFKQPPSIQIRKVNEDGTTTLLETGDERDKLADFQNNVDGKGTDLVTWWAEKVETKLLLYGKTYILFDLPVTPQVFSAAQQQALGALRPHLVGYQPQDFINWQIDENGALTWAVLKLRARYQETPLDPVQIADRWYWFTPDAVAVYEYKFPISTSSAVLEPSNQIYDDNAKATLVENYPRPHALADQARLPIFVEHAEDNYHLGSDIASPLVRLLNLENTHDWSLQQSNLASLVIYSDEAPDSIRRSEASYLTLKPTDKAEFLEQSGRAFTASQSRISEVREEVYRLAHLIQQGRSSSATAAAQSGIAKEADLTPARDVLSALGDQTRRSMRRVLQAAADRMDLKVTVDVAGLDFPDRSESIELENLERAQATADISVSPTLERQVAKRIARIMIPDANRELLEKIDAEIDANPTPSEAAAQQQATALNQRLRQLSQSLTNKSMIDEANAA